MIPLHKTVTVPLAPHEAFTLFINDMATWWPVDKHSVSGRSGKGPKLKVTARKGGAIAEVTPDGRRILWGQIIAWDDGKFAAFTWHPGTDADDATIVTVAFVACPEGCTVTLTHGDYAILGVTADAVSTSYLKGWDLVLGSYCKAASRVLIVA